MVSDLDRVLLNSFLTTFSATVQVPASKRNGESFSFIFNFYLCIIEPVLFGLFFYILNCDIHLK